MGKDADATAPKLKISRSELIRRALREFLQLRRDQKITESINRHIAKHGNELSAEDEAWLEHGRRTVLRSFEELEALPAAKGKWKRRARP
jgi:metal-responsive CopG/Arc/MetJ family transcriptional regulator